VTANEYRVQKKTGQGFLKKPNPVGFVGVSATCSCCQINVEMEND